MSVVSVLGIDPSLRATGWVAAKVGTNSEKIKIKGYGVITPNMRGDARLYHIESRLKIICLAYGIEQVFLENYAYSRTVGLAFNIGELGGVIRRFLFSWDLDYKVIQPTELKKRFTGHGRAKKEKMVRVARKRARIRFKKVRESLVNNVADAYALVWVGSRKHLF